MCYSCWINVCIIIICVLKLRYVWSFVIIGWQSVQNLERVLAIRALYGPLVYSNRNLRIVMKFLLEFDKI